MTETFCQKGYGYKSSFVLFITKYYNISIADVQHAVVDSARSVITQMVRRGYLKLTTMTLWAILPTDLDFSDVVTVFQMQNILGNY